MNRTLTAISALLFISTTQLFCMHGPTTPLVRHIAQKLWRIVRPTDPSAQLGIVIGTTYTTTTWLILPIALYYFDRDAYQQWFKKHSSHRARKYGTKNSSSDNQNHN